MAWTHLLRISALGLPALIPLAAISAELPGIRLNKIRPEMRDARPLRQQPVTPRDALSLGLEPDTPRSIAHVVAVAKKADPADRETLKAEFPALVALIEPVTPVSARSFTKNEMLAAEAERLGPQFQSRALFLRQQRLDQLATARDLVETRITLLPELFEQAFQQASPAAFRSQEALFNDFKKDIVEAVANAAARRGQPSPTFTFEVLTGKLKFETKRDLGPWRISLGEINVYDLAWKILGLTSVTIICSTTESCKLTAEQFLADLHQKLQSDRLRSDIEGPTANDVRAQFKAAYDPACDIPTNIRGRVLRDVARSRVTGTDDPPLSEDVVCPSP